MTEVEKVQKLTLFLFKEYIEICEKNNLRYYLMGGSLIGALRHDGFVPWDDDIDVGMPRSDFERFHEILKKGMPKGYGICNRFTDENWHFAMSQFIDMESEIDIYLAEEKRIAHIWIDVFPLDGLPSNIVRRFFRVKHILLYRYLVQIANISTQVDINRERPIYEKAILFIFKIIPMGRFINSNKILDKLDKLLKKCDYDHAEWAGNMLGRYREKEVVPQAYFGEPIEKDFEGIKVNIPEEFHALQTHVYGNYMELPPIEERNSHKVKIIKCREINDDYEGN